jgi:hypothetical protein
MTNTMKITVAELEAMLASLKPGANIITLSMATTPRMRKTGNMYFGKVRKHATANVQIQADYERAINAQRTREGKPSDFKAQPRVWGERIGNTCLIDNNGRKYMAFRALRCLRSTLRDLQGHFLPENVVEAIKGFIYVSKSKTQKTDVEIIWRTVALENVRRININKKRYEVVQG